MAKRLDIKEILGYNEVYCFYKGGKNMLNIKKIDVDSPEYKQIESSLFFKGESTLELIESFCNSSGVSIYAAKDGSLVTGFCVTDSSTGDVIHLLFIGVHHGHHRSGVATALLDYALADQNPKAMVAEIPESSLEFFKNYGFYFVEFGEGEGGKNVYYGTYRRK